MFFTDARKLFMKRCVAKRLSNSTLRTYENFFNSVERFLKKKEIEDVECITSEVIREYIIDAQNSMIGITILGYYTRLCTFFTFLKREQILPTSPMVRVDKPRVEKRLIPSFDSTEVHKMLNSYDTDTFIGRRNYTLLSMLLSTGLRRSEFLSLTLMDVNLKNNFIRVIGKGDKERLVPIGKALNVIIRKYLKERQEYLKGYANTPFFFITKDRRQMSVGASNTVFRKLRIELNLQGKRFSAHVWRHTFAKAFLLNGGDIFTLQELLGHEDVETTRVYVSLTNADKQMQNRKFNPLDNNRWEYY